MLGEDSSFAREACPTCKGLIGRKPEDPFFLDPDDPDSRTYCEACGAMAPRHEANVLGSRLGLIASKVADQAERTAILALRARARLGLTDSDRRKIAAGHRSYFGSSWRQVTNLSRLGRRFLAGQCADVETVGQTA